MMNKLIHGRLDDMLSQKKEIEGVSVLSARIDGLDPAALRDTAGKLKERLGSGIVVLGSDNGDKVSFVAMAASDTVKRGIHAGNILKEVASITGGGGGGRPDMAQAGGRDAAMLDKALESVYEAVKKQLCGGAN
jgi:alanyl-tRNA synthetase